MSKNRDLRAPIDLQAAEQEYRKVAPLLESYCDEMAHQVAKLLDEADAILGFPIQRRVKSWESLSEKFARLPRFTQLEEIQDVVGLRVILLFKRDVGKAVQLIQDNFEVVRQYDTLERLKEDQFGYSSKHLIVRLKREWLSVPTLAKFGGLVAEIQIRTLPQHIWAEASHRFQYKQEQNIPPVVRRSIFRVSALLETVDLEFERVLEDWTFDIANLSPT